MLVSSLFRLTVLMNLLSETAKIKEKDLDMVFNHTEASFYNPVLDHDLADISTVVRLDNCPGLKNFKDQGGLTLFYQSEPLKDFHFEYTFDDFKSDFLENGRFFVWDAGFDQDVECKPEKTEIKLYNSCEYIDDHIFKLLGTRRTSITSLYNNFEFIDDHIFKLLETFRNSITSVYEKNFIIKRGNYYKENENILCDEIIVIVNEVLSFFYKNYVLYLNKFKMLINSLKDFYNYVKNLFEDIKPTEVSIRSNQEFKKLPETEHINCEKSIICKINEIEKQIAQLEKNLDDLMYHIKGNQYVGTKHGTILLFFLKIGVILTILCGFKEFRIRVPVKKSLIK